MEQEATQNPVCGLALPQPGCRQNFAFQPPDHRLRSTHGRRRRTVARLFGQKCHHAQCSFSTSAVRWAAARARVLPTPARATRCRGSHRHGFSLVDVRRGSGKSPKRALTTCPGPSTCTVAQRHRPHAVCGTVVGNGARSRRCNGQH